MTDRNAWQLKMFKKTLKKRLRLKHLRFHLGSLSHKDSCILLTCGDNNGATNFHLRELGGKWSWADLEEKSIKEMSELLGEEVFHVAENNLPFPDRTFDCFVSIDVHEHLEDPNSLIREIWRVTKPGGKVIVTVPSGDETKAATRMKKFIGMTKEKYGHVREGYNISELKEMLKRNQIEPQAESSFSKFFTEILELGINFLYVNLLSKKSKSRVELGTIAPLTWEQLQSVKKNYTLYSLVHPLFWLISKLDIFCLNSSGYAVVVVGKKA